jgi:HEPN domain-containing protein
VTRRDLRELALIRLKEAWVLLRNGYYDGAYYLSGYCIECALKACIAKRTCRYEFPDKKTADASHTHRLEDLLRVAQLSEEHRKEVRANVLFEAKWNVVKDWSEHSRYEKHSREDAENILAAISDKTHGVFKWIMQHW